VKNRFGLFGVIVVVAVIGLSMTGCATDPSVTRGGWSEYNIDSDGEYLIVGTVIVTNARRATLLADLMNKAIEMGAHDIINVRVGVTDLFGFRVRSATAVAIRYVNELVRPDPPRPAPPAAVPPPYVPAEAAETATPFMEY